MNHDDSPHGIGTEIKDAAVFFFRNLFDVRMRTLLSFCTLPIIYGIWIAFSAGYVIERVIEAFDTGWLTGLFWLVLVGPLLFVTAITVLRVLLEFMLSVFRLSIQVEAVVQQTGEIADDMPRLQFWKSFRVRREQED